MSQTALRKSIQLSKGHSSQLSSSATTYSSESLLRLWAKALCFQKGGDPLDLEYGRDSYMLDREIEDAPDTFTPHCWISYANRVVSVLDLEGSCGTWVNEARITPGEKFILHNSDEICLGEPEPDGLQREAKVTSTEPNRFRLVIYEDPPSPSSGQFQDTYKQEKRLGAGSFGTVFEAIPLKPSAGQDKKFAVKWMDKSKATAPALVQIERELLTLRSLKHQGVLRYVDEFHMKNDVGLVTEYIPSDLKKFSKKVLAPLPPASREPIVKEIARQVVDAMAYVHGCQILHRDLKPENILVDDDDKREDEKAPIKVVVADFGLAKFNGLEQATKELGTILYSAPEVFHEGDLDYDFSVDSFSVGITLLDLLCEGVRGSMFIPPAPSADTDEARKTWVVDRKINPRVFHDLSVSDSCQDFITRMTLPAPERMTMKDAQAHGWISGGNL